MLRIQRLILLLVSVVALSACSISGTIADEEGAGVAGVTVTLTGAADRTTTTNADGNYIFAFLGTGDYLITPSLADTLFTPADIALTKSLPFASETGNDFVATAADPGALIYEHSMVYIGVDMTLSVYEGETGYIFELFRNGTASGAENAGCVVDHVINTVAISKDVVLELSPDSTVDDLVYPLFMDPSGDVTDVTIRQYDSDFLQLVTWVHPDDGCPSTDLHFEVVPNTGVFAGETLEDFFDRF